MAQQSEQLERQADHVRSQLEGTIEELRGRLSPGQFVDQLMDYTRNGAAMEFARNLGRDIRKNPLPVVLLWTGFAWLMMKSGNETSMAHSADDSRKEGNRVSVGLQDKITEAGEGLRKRAQTAADTAASTAESIGERAKTAATGSADLAAEMKSQASDAMSQAGEKAAWMKGKAAANLHSAADKAGETAQIAKEKAGSLGRSATESGRKFLQFCQDQPLVLAGLGVATGAIIGGLFPATGTEDRLMGQASDQMKQAGADQFEKVKGTATETIASAAQKVSDQAAATVEEMGSSAPQAR